jgi:arylsulfatase A-like enzyme
VFTVDDILPDSLPTLPEQLKRNGFHTIAISAIGNISPGFGFERGFDRFIELYKDATLVEKRQTIDVRDAGRSLHFRVESNHVPIATSEDINLSLFECLGEVHPHNIFALIWSIDTHSPYFHRDPSLARSIDPSLAIWSPKEIMSMKTENELKRLRLLYEDMIFYNDHFIGKLVERLQDMNLWEDTMFILTGDHGEAFSEHGVNSHGWGAPFDELVRIPLIVKFPHSEFQGPFNELVQEIDIAPTILDYLSLVNTCEFWQGRSMLPIIQSRKEINNVVFVEAQQTRAPCFYCCQNQGIQVY